MDERQASRGASLSQAGRSKFVCLAGFVGLGFGEVDLGIAGRIDHRCWPVACNGTGNVTRVWNVGLRVRERRERDRTRLCHACELLAELATASKDQDHATTPSRSPR